MVVIKENGFAVVMSDEYPNLPRGCVKVYRQMGKGESFIKMRNDNKMSQEEKEAQALEAQMLAMKAKIEEEAKWAVQFEEFKKLHPKEICVEDLFYLTVVKRYAKSTVAQKMGKLRKEAKAKAKLEAELEFIDNLEVGVAV